MDQLVIRIKVKKSSYCLKKHIVYIPSWWYSLKNQGDLLGKQAKELSTIWGGLQLHEKLVVTRTNTIQYLKYFLKVRRGMRSSWVRLVRQWWWLCCGKYWGFPRWQMTKSKTKIKKKYKRISDIGPPWFLLCTRLNRIYIEFHAWGNITYTPTNVFFFFQVRRNCPSPRLTMDTVPRWSNDHQWRISIDSNEIITRFEKINCSKDPQKRFFNAQ